MSNDTIDPAQAFAWMEKKFDKMQVTPSLEFLKALGIPVHEGDENMPLAWHIRNQREREIKSPSRFGLGIPLPPAIKDFEDRD